MTAPVTPARLRRAERGAGALLHASSAKAKRPADLAKWAADPLGFITVVLGGQPRGKQIEIVQALRDHRQQVVMGCHGSGKDYVAARIALWWVYALGGRVIATGPTQRQLVDIVFSELRRAMRDEAAVPLFGELYQQELWLEGEKHAGIQGFVSSQDSRLTGLHAPRTLVILTEAQGIPDFAFEALEGNALDPEDRVLALGNTLASSTGWFRRACLPTSNWHRVRITATDVFESGINVPGGTRIPGMITPSWVEQKRREYGPTSPFCVAKIDAQFPEDGAEFGVATRALLDRAAALYESGALACKLSVATPFALGCDVGRGGDPSAICTMRGPVVHGVETFPTPTGNDAADAVLRHIAVLGSDGYGLGRADVSGVIIDAIGIGASPVDILNERGVPLTEFKGNAAPTDPHYANARAEAYGLLGAKLARGELAIKPDEELWDEILAQRYFVNARGQVQMIDMDDLRSALGRSPNKADALAMAVYDAETGTNIGGSPLTL